MTALLNRKFPGPLLRFEEGKQVTIDINNQTDTPEQLHWHGQFLFTDVDGSAEEGTPFIPPHGSHRITFVPKPSGYPFCHTHVRAGANLSAGHYTELVGPVYIEPKNHPGNYDREVFLTLKEFEPVLSRGGDMAMNFLSPAATVKELKNSGEKAMNASLAKGAPHGFEVGYGSFTINGRMLGRGEPIRLKKGGHVLFHVLNGSATEIRSLALPGHHLHGCCDGRQPDPKAGDRARTLAGNSRASLGVCRDESPRHLDHGRYSKHDRQHGMGIVIEYGGQKGKPRWVAPKPFQWNYSHFGNHAAAIPQLDQIFEMTFAKENAAENGFDRRTINNVAFSDDHVHPMFSHQAGQTVPATHAQRKRRHLSDSSSPPQFRADAGGRAPDVRRH
jgi:hypothetical protein